MNTKTAISAVNEPRYSMIARQLVADITQGKIAVGQMLPTEKELTRDFGASRHTVRSALKQLQELGFVSTLRGRGSEVVSNQPIRNGIGFSFDSLNDFLEIAKLTKLTRVRKTHERVGRYVSQPTGWGIDERCLCVRALRTSKLDNALIAYIEIYLRWQYASIESLIGRKSIAISRLVEEQFGIRIKEVRQVIRPCELDAHIAKELGSKVGSLGLTVGRSYNDHNDQVFMHVVSYQAGAGASIELRLRYNG